MLPSNLIYFICGSPAKWSTCLYGIQMVVGHCYKRLPALSSTSGLYSLSFPEFSTVCRISSFVNG